MVGQPRRNFINLVSWSKVSERLVNLIRISDQPKRNNQILNLEVISVKILEKMRMMWNDIIEDGVAFPRTDVLSKEIFNQMISQQDVVNYMYVDKILVGYYILYPNNIGRCLHVANASYVLDKTMREKYLVEHSIKTAKE